MDTEQDPEWDALLAVVRARPDLAQASRTLAEESGLDEEGGVRRLVWAAILNGRGLPEAAWQVLSDAEPDGGDPFRGGPDGLRGPGPSDLG